MSKLNKITKFMLKKLNLLKYSDYYKGFGNIDKYKEIKGKKLFLMMLPNYGNVGDQAIAYATEEYLSNHFSDFTIIKVAVENTYSELPAIKKSLKKDDIIVLQGGGNFGNLYLYIEEARRFIVKRIKNVKIISFPCSICYTEDAVGQRELEKSAKIYNANKNFTIISRDRPSFDFAKKHFANCKNILNPDMVFYLWKEREIDMSERRGVNICLRFDNEKSKKVDRTSIVKAIEEKYEDYCLVDTQLGRPVREELRKEEIYSIMRSLATGKVVVTDRLHGMVLSVVSGVPCVVLPSGDNKTYATYQWINDVSSVKFCTTGNIEEILSYVDELYALDKVEYKEIRKKYFETLRESLLG